MVARSWRTIAASCSPNENDDDIPDRNPRDTPKTLGLGFPTTASRKIFLRFATPSVVESVANGSLKRLHSSSMRSSVSVTIVTYKARHFIESCLESVLQQNIPLDVVVVDNASMD